MNDLNPLLAREAMRDRARAAGLSRLTALASCCRPSTWRRVSGRWWRAARTAVQQGRSPSLTDARPCCA